MKLACLNVVVFLCSLLLYQKRDPEYMYVVGDINLSNLHLIAALLRTRTFQRLCWKSPEYLLCSVPSLSFTSLCTSLSGIRSWPSLLLVSGKVRGAPDLAMLCVSNNIQYSRFGGSLLLKCEPLTRHVD